MKQAAVYGLVGFGLAAAISGIVLYIKQQKKEKKTNGESEKSK